MKKRWIVLVVLITAVLSFSGGIATTVVAVRPMIKKAEQVQIAKTVTQKTSPNSDELWKLVNDYRVSLGLKALTRDPRLDKSASAKCDDMISKNYWSHNTPDGVAPFAFFEIQEVKYKKAGENLAYGFNTAQDTVQGWKLSPTHNENMTDPIYTTVGYGVCHSMNYINSGEEYVVVQHLAKI